jgi:hypothetical protein
MSQFEIYEILKKFNKNNKYLNVYEIVSLLENNNLFYSYNITNLNLLRLLKGGVCERKKKLITLNLDKDKYHKVMKVNVYRIKKKKVKN